MEIKISIVVPSYNQGHFLEETFQSILSQNYKNLEIIVIDGGSTDASLDVIKRYEPWLYYWQSKPDKGQSDAINQGFRCASGEFVTWLNSDDLLLPGTLNAVAKAAKQNPAISWFAGNLIWIDPFGNIELCRKGEQWNHTLVKNGTLNLYGPSSFFKKGLLDQYGYLREDFQYMMDTELWWRFVSNNIPFKRLKQYCWAYRLHETSKMSGHRFQNSELSDEEHPSWKQKRWEESEIKNLYTSPNVNKLTSKSYLAICRLFSPSYLHGRIDDILFYGKKINQLPFGR